MKIAVTYVDGKVFPHFGKTSQFKVFVVEDGAVISSELVSPNGAGHGALAGFLKERGADVVICGGIGAPARAALVEAGMKVYGGACGAVDSVVADFMAGNLSYEEAATCDHHGHEHGEGHSCGDHGCH